MALATLVFWMGRTQFAHIPPSKDYLKQFTEKSTQRDLAKLWLIFAFVVLFWALFDQIGTLWQVQSRGLDRVLPEWVPFFSGHELLPAQVSAVFNPLFILLLVPIFHRLVYPFITVSPLWKIGAGLWLTAIAFLVTTILQYLIESGLRLHVGWQIFACLILTAAEVLVSITCLEFAYSQAPKSMKSFVMAMFLLTVALGNYLASFLKFLICNGSGVPSVSTLEEFAFWTLLMGIASLFYIFVSRRYRLYEHMHETG